jgi:hypothetical protein
MNRTLTVIAVLLVVVVVAPAAWAAQAAIPGVGQTAPLLDVLSNHAQKMACTIRRARANDDTASTTINTAVTINVFANDAGLGIRSITSPSHGTAQLGANWTIIYTPDTGFTGTDSFVYFVNGCLQCFNGWCSEPDIDDATVTVTVTQ